MKKSSYKNSILSGSQIYSDVQAKNYSKYSL